METARYSPEHQEEQKLSAADCSLQGELYEKAFRCSVDGVFAVGVSVRACIMCHVMSSLAAAMLSIIVLPCSAIFLRGLNFANFLILPNLQIFHFAKCSSLLN